MRIFIACAFLFFVFALPAQAEQKTIVVEFVNTTTQTDQKLTLDAIGRVLSYWSNNGIPMRIGSVIYIDYEYPQYRYVYNGDRAVSFIHVINSAYAIYSAPFVYGAFTQNNQVYILANESEAELAHQIGHMLGLASFPQCTNADIMCDYKRAYQQGIIGRRSRSYLGLPYLVFTPEVAR